MKKLLTLLLTLICFNSYSFNCKHDSTKFAIKTEPNSLSMKIYHNDNYMIREITPDEYTLYRNKDSIIVSCKEADRLMWDMRPPLFHSIKYYIGMVFYWVSVAGFIFLGIFSAIVLINSTIHPARF